MHELLLPSLVRAQLAALAKNPPHALLLVGPTGFGKRTIAQMWAQTYTQPEIVEPDSKNILSIEVIRDLYRQTRSRKEDRQAVIIDQAHTMGLEAQNAFLKLLEEPRPGVTFILTAPSADTLLPTITSRTQIVTLRPVAATELTALAKKINPNLAQTELVQLLFIAQGRPGALVAALGNEQSLAAERARMQQAKILLTATPYERLARVGELTKDRTLLVDILEAMTIMVKIQLAKNSDQKWFKMADALETCLGRLAQNGNLRAQLTHFFLSY